MRTKAGLSWLGKCLKAGSAFAFLIGACFAHVAPVIASEAVAVAGTTVTMTPPDGFVPATDFTGFLNMEKRGSLFIAELPAEAMGPLSALFSDHAAATKGFASKGITVTEREDIEAANGQMVPLLHGTQEASGIVLDKWMALYGGEKTVLITFQVPQENAFNERILKAVFASVSTRSATSIHEKLAALPFEFDVAEPFRIIDIMGGSAIAMMAGTKDVDPRGRQPMIIVAVSQASAETSNLEMVAERILRETTGFEAAEVTVKEATSFAGAHGYLLKGIYEDEGKRKTFEQYFSIVGARTVRLIGSASENEFVALQGSIKAIAASVRFKK